MDERKTKRGIAAPEAAEEEKRNPSIPELAAHVIKPVTKTPPETISRHFLGISLGRAFRLHIRNEDVLPQERSHLEAQASHITDPDHQAFLAWRRSVLLLIAVLFVPLTISRFLETYNSYQISATAKGFLMLPVVADAMFCILMFAQLKNWAQWKKQRRILFIAWGIYFLAPFIVYLYPFRYTGENITEVKAALKVLPFHLSMGQLRLSIGVGYGIMAIIALAPKVISLMPGVIRASIVSKLLFPGTSAPGWLMLIAAPFYALFAYVIVLLPYQITGSWQFLVGNAGILCAQIFIGISGRRLTEPLTTEESDARIHKTWLAYILIMVVGAGFMLYGLADVVRELHLGIWSVTTGVFGVVSNVLLDTLVGTDAIVSAMAHFRRQGPPDPKHVKLLDEAEAKLAKFAG